MTHPLPIEQILDDPIPQEAAQTALTEMGITNAPAAARRLQRIAGQSADARQALIRLLPTLSIALSNCADADQALINLERFASGSDSAGSLEQLIENPRAIEILITIFAGSQFLTEILVREPSHLKMLTRREWLAQQKKPKEFQNEALRALAENSFPEEQLSGLHHYQHGELLRIGASDLLGLYDLPAVTSQLSHLADSMAQACLTFATPLVPPIFGVQNGGMTGGSGFVVLAMGKLGGEELNYSSDIDLLFLCSGEAGNYLRLGQTLIEALSSMTTEGFLYRVDMRLRPWGRDGALVTSLDNYLTYLNKNAMLWEKQALLKARPIAGDLSLGGQALQQIGTVIFGASAETVRASVHAMKQRTEEILRAKGRDWGEVKLGEGSIRDVEFVVQFLQLAYGGGNPSLRERSTLKALPHLVQAGLLTAQESRVLTDGYIFLRTVEHFLQMLHYRQTYTLPSDPNAITLLARRLGFRGAQTQEQFLGRYQQHSLAIRAIYSKYVSGEALAASEITLVEPAPVIAIQQHLARMEASYSATFSEDEIRRHAILADQLNDEQLVIVDAQPTGGAATSWRVTIVAYDYLGELSLICGLMFVYGLDIQDGQVFTYEAAQKPEAESGLTAFRPKLRFRPGRSIKAQADESLRSTSNRRKIVDVFTVQPGKSAEFETPSWEQYSADLRDLLKLMQAGQRREARSALAKRIGEVFHAGSGAAQALYPIEIKIDNETSDRYTILHISTANTVGFLYEFTNALSLTHTHIARMLAESQGKRANDILYVTDENGGKITSPEKQRELRASAVLIKHFTHLLPYSPDPASALLHFREFLAQLFARPNWPDELLSIERPEVLGNLARLLGVSNFLWDDFMRMQSANLFPLLSDADALKTAKSRALLKVELDQTLERAPKAWQTALNESKDREMFRIDMRHLLGYTSEFWDFSEELTDLAEVIVEAAFALTIEDLRQLHGTPRAADGQAARMCVLALGKCGGRELGFASDIELMFVYEGDGLSDGPESIPSANFHEKVAQAFLTAIRARQEGVFQVDLQLRPYGKAGSMAVSLDAFQRYYAPEGPAWAYERQALVKMRPIAGDEYLGQKLSALRDKFIYNETPFDVTAMRAMRERQIRHLVAAGSFNAKYSPGGLVDVEYLTQGLQITHGGSNPALRQTNIRKAVSALHEAGILSDEDYTRLHKAYTFLRWLIDAMRVVRGNAKDVTTPAYGSEEFNFLARRLLYGNEIDRLREDLLRYQTDVQEINARLL